jgi:23S rRNA G2445 N2-methylase RlmL
MCGVLLLQVGTDKVIFFRSDVDQEHSYRSSNDCLYIPANINRKEFVLENGIDWDNELFDNITTSLLKRARVSPIRLPDTIKHHRRCRKRLIHQKCQPRRIHQNRRAKLFDTEKQPKGNSYMVLNPPYDERLDIHMEEFYKKHRRYLKEKLSWNEPLACTPTSKRRPLTFVKLNYLTRVSKHV